MFFICGDLATVSARAVDEIQVYNADIAKVGQWTFQLHSNYAFMGRKEPDFPGGLIPNHALNGTGEWAYGITDWWEMGFYTPFAVEENLTPYSNAAKIRQLFVIPNAAEREFFYGVNFEFSYAMPQFSDTQWNMEIRPIVGWRKGGYEFILNPIVDIGFGQNGGAVFAPAARFARNLSETLSVGVEYYTELGGSQQSWLPFNEQQHNIYAVVDFCDLAARRSGSSTVSDVSRRRFRRQKIPAASFPMILSTRSERTSSSEARDWSC